MYTWQRQTESRDVNFILERTQTGRATGAGTAGCASTHARKGPRAQVPQTILRIHSRLQRDGSYRFI